MYYSMLRKAGKWVRRITAVGQRICKSRIQVQQHIVDCGQEAFEAFPLFRVRHELQPLNCDVTRTTYANGILAFPLNTEASFVVFGRHRITLSSISAWTASSHAHLLVVKCVCDNLFTFCDLAYP
jgi:hypothetical protein